MSQCKLRISKSRLLAISVLLMAILGVASILIPSIDVEIRADYNVAPKVIQISLWQRFALTRELLSNPMNTNPARYESLAWINVGPSFFPAEIGVFFPIGEFKVGDVYYTGTAPTLLGLLKEHVPELSRHFK